MSVILLIAALAVSPIASQPPSVVAETRPVLRAPLDPCSFDPKLIAAGKPACQPDSSPARKNPLNVPDNGAPCVGKPSDPAALATGHCVLIEKHNPDGSTTRSLHWKPDGVRP